MLGIPAFEQATAPHYYGEGHSQAISPISRSGATVRQKKRAYRAEHRSSRPYGREGLGGGVNRVQWFLL